MFRKINSLAILLLALNTQAQIGDPPPVQIDHELEAGYRDSVRSHENTDLHYRPHCCQNRYGKYGWVGKYHQVFIPFEYSFFQNFAKLSDYNIAQKGKFYGALDAQGRVVLPFKYTGVTPLDKQELVICHNGPYKKTVLNFQGQVIIPEDSLYLIWLFNDTSLAVQYLKMKDTRICDLRGNHVKTWNYRHIAQLPSGRFKVSKDTLIGINMLTISGLLDASGAIIVPIQFTDISWEQGDWARVLNYKTKTRGLYQISTQTLHPDTYYFIAPPDQLGNFTFWVGESSEETRVGLLNADFQEIYPAVYHNIFLLDDMGHYGLRGNRSRRGDLFGVGDAKGNIVIDTVLLGFKPTIIETPTRQNSRGQWYIDRDTLPFLVFEDARTEKKGLWHRQYGQIRPPEYDYIGGLTQSTFFQEKGDTTHLFQANGQLLAGPYYRVRSGPDNRYFIARPNWNDTYILLDLEGRFIRELESEPRLLADGVYLMYRYAKAPNGYSEVKRFALFDRDLKPVTEFIFETEPMPLERFKLEQRIRLLELGQPAGYGRWVGWMQKNTDEPMLLLDEQGKTFELR